MKPFESVKSTITPLDKINVDTDQIVPKQFLKLVQRSGFGKYLFYDWRYAISQDGSVTPRSDFVLNNSKYDGSEILVTGENFGCGSSREHAVWALADHGFKVIIAPSFADIFYSNCTKNGVLPVTLKRDETERLLRFDGAIEVSLEDSKITLYGHGKSGHDTMHFEIEPHRRATLLEGLDEVAQTLKYNSMIEEFERKRSHSAGAAPPMNI